MLAYLCKHRYVDFFMATLAQIKILDIEHRDSKISLKESRIWYYCMYTTDAIFHLEDQPKETSRLVITPTAGTF